MTHDLAPASAESLSALLLSSRTSEETRKSYGASLRALATFLGLTDVDDLARVLFLGTHRDAQRIAARWKTSLVQSGAAPATINGKLSALRSLVSLARVEGVVPWTLELPGVRGRRYRDTAGPDEAAYSRILAACETPREVAVIRLMGDAGLRSIEVRRLDAGDVDEQGRRVLVRGKGASREPAPVPLGPKALAAILAHLAGRRSGPAFPGRSGARASREVVRWVVEAVAARSGVRFTAHALRHRAATRIAEITHDVRAVQAVLRHSDLRTSQLYLDRVRLDLPAVMERAEG